MPTIRDGGSAWSEAYKEAKYLKTKERELVRQLAEVRLSLARACSRLKEIKNEAAPISKLPNEMFAAIFMAGHKLSSCIDLPFEILVSHVSRRWRDVAINLPSLWTDITDYMGKSMWPLYIYLQRSKTCPLDLKLYYHHRRPLCPGHIERIMSLITPHVARIRQLSIQVVHSRKALDQIITPLSGGFAAQLERLEIGDYTSDSHIVYPSIFTAGAPVLSTLRLHNSFPELSPLFSSVTDLGIYSGCAYDPRPGYFRDLLNACPRLTQLGLDEEFVLDFIPLETGFVKAPSLHSLVIYFGGDVDLRTPLRMCKSLHVPSLESLVFWSIHSEEVVSFFQDIGSLPTPLYPLMKSLAFVSRQGQKVDCGRCDLQNLPLPAWPAFPNLTHLTLVNVCFINSILKELFLDLAVDGESSVDDASRFKEGSPLYSLTIADQGLEKNTVRAVIASRLASGRPISQLRLSRVFVADLGDEFEWFRSRVELEIFDVEELLDSLDCRR